MAEKVIRKRGWFVQRNWDYDKNDPTGNYNGLDEDEWQDGIQAEWDALAQGSNIDWCHFIFHDADLQKDDKGTVTTKPIHAHAVIKYKDARTQTAVMKDFCGSNQRSENCQWVDPQKGGYRQCLLYLTHHTTSAYNAEKTWYHHGSVCQHGSQRYLDLIKTDKKGGWNMQEIEQVLNDYVNKIVYGEVRLTAAKSEFMELTSPSVLVKHNSTLENAFETYKEFKTKEMQRLSDLGMFNKSTTYISGSSQTGKSALASMLAVDRVGVDDVFTVASGGSSKITTDFVDGHEGERASIFNDVEPMEYGYRAFYNMFDPSKWSLTKSRNINKPWLSEFCYIATALHIGDFVIQMYTGGISSVKRADYETAFELRQAFRRVQQVLVYGIDDSENAVLWVAKLKPVLPTEKELLEYAGMYTNGTFTSDVATMFYDSLGRVPYDKTITSSKAFHDERGRVAHIVNQVIDGNMNVAGFIKS